MTTADLDPQHAPDACTLPTAELPGRLAEFDELFATALYRQQRLTPTRLRMLLDPAAGARTRDLTTREATCCSFFAFTFTRTTDSTLGGEVLQLEVDVPSAHADVLDGIQARAAAATTTST